MLPYPDAPPNFLSLALQARRAGEEDRFNAERRNALMAGDQNALRGLGDFQSANAMQAEQDRGRRQQTLGAYASDPAGARRMALEAGDVELLGQIIGLDDNQRKEAMERAERLAGVGIALRQRPYEERRAALQQIAPALQGLYGFTPEQLAQFDPTDESLDAVIGSALKPRDYLALGNDALKDQLLQAQIEATRALVPQRQASAAASEARADLTRRTPPPNRGRGGGRGGGGSAAVPAGFVLD